MPNWMDSESPINDEKVIIKYSCLFTFIFKVIFTITFSNALLFSDLFNSSSYITSSYSYNLKLSVATFLLLVLLNNIMIHTTLLYNYLQTYSPCTIPGLQAYAFPWIVSLFLVNNQIYLSVLNW